LKSILNYIDGKFVRAKREFADVNPADGSVIAQVSEADEGLVDDAVRAARGALQSEWGRWGIRERAARLHRVADAIEARFVPLAEALAMVAWSETRRIIAEAVQEGRYVAARRPEIVAARVAKEAETARAAETATAAAAAPPSPAALSADAPQPAAVAQQAPSLLGVGGDSAGGIAVPVVSRGALGSV